MLKKDRIQIEQACKEATANAFFCRADAQAAAEKLIHSANMGYHQIAVDIEKVPKFGRGRPAKGKPRKVLRHEYVLTTKITEAPEKIEPLRIQAGCFVLLTNLVEKRDEWPAIELLKLYKSQIGIEKNFSFLKDPMIANSIFLKKPERIEVLGLVLLSALLIWRLMERSMRKHVEANDCTLTGWERRPTKKPTAFMMTTKFASILAITIGKTRQLAKPFKDFQCQYLKAMGVSQKVFTDP